MKLKSMPCSAYQTLSSEVFDIEMNILMLRDQVSELEAEISKNYMELIEKRAKLTRLNDAD